MSMYEKKIMKFEAMPNFLTKKKNVTDDIGKTDLSPVQVIAINGVSLVGLPLSTCQQYIKVRLQTLATQTV